MNGQDSPDCPCYSVGRSPWDSRPLRVLTTHTEIYFGIAFGHTQSQHLYNTQNPTWPLPLQMPGDRPQFVGVGFCCKPRRCTRPPAWTDLMALLTTWLGTVAGDCRPCPVCLACSLRGPSVAWIARSRANAATGGVDTRKVAIGGIGG